MIVVDKVTKYYGAHAAVRDLSFRIEEGECVGFLGLNGAGKTTTLRLLSCLLLPTSGRATIRGLDVEASAHEIRKFIGFLPDVPPVYDEMTVLDYVRFAGKLRQMSKAELAARIPDVLKDAGLEAVADQSISMLSHGYRQRVGIAQAIVHKPALLILDEPINGLDPVQIVEMRELIRRLRGKHTILLSTHILSEIEQTCDRILMLNQGAVAAQGTEEELIARFTRGAVAVLEVRVPDTDGFPATPKAKALAEALRKLPTVTDVSVGRGLGPQVVHVEVTADEDVREQAAAAVVAQGCGLLGLSPKTTGLENIFVNLSKAGAA